MRGRVRVAVGSTDCGADMSGRVRVAVDSTNCGADMRCRVSVAVPARDSVWVNLSGGVRVWVLASAPPPPGQCVWVSVLVNDRVLV
eukprot:gene13150-biopygen16520